MDLPQYAGPFVKAVDSPWCDYLEYGSKRAFKANVTLLHPGEQVRYLYYVQEGEILVTHVATAEDNFKVHIIGANAVAGIIEMFSPLPPQTAWRTLQPCICRLFSRDSVEKELPRELLLNLLEQVSYMGVNMAGRFSNGLSKHNDVRLARFLLHFAEACPTRQDPDKPGVTVIPGITQALSSELLGMHPVTFNKLLAGFRRQGIIGKTKQNSLEILDLKALSAQASRG